MDIKAFSDSEKIENQILQFRLDWEDTFETITDMITIHDMDFNIVNANKAAIKTLGLPFLYKKKSKCYEFYHGKHHPPDNCLSCQCLLTGKPTSFETFEPHLDKHLEVRAIPRFDSHKQMVGTIHIVRDLTERKKVEEALRRVEQMKIVGEWATGLAHEIKNPLAGIKASVEVLLNDLNISADDRSIVLRSMSEIKRIEKLLKNLLNFAKPPKIKLMAVDMNTLLDQVIDISLKHPFLSSDSSIEINISKDFDKNIPLVQADSMQLHQVFLNLLFNAIEAMPDGGELNLKSRYDQNEEAVKIEISDTGDGIEPKMIDDIFKPFFSTKSKGTGFGLAISRRILEEHGGTISVSSNSGDRTTFCVSLLATTENGVKDTAFKLPR